MNQHVAHRRSDEIHELRAEIERLQLERDNYIKTTGDLLIDNEQLRAALALSQSQNYCTLCGRDLDLAAALERKDKIG